MTTLNDVDVWMNGSLISGHVILLFSKFMLLQEHFMLILRDKHKEMNPRLDSFIAIHSLTWIIYPSSKLFREA